MSTALLGLVADNNLKSKWFSYIGVCVRNIKLLILLTGPVDIFCTNFQLQNWYKNFYKFFSGYEICQTITLVEN